MRKVILLTVFFLQIIFLLFSGYAQERMYFDRATLRDPFIAPENFEKSYGQSQALFTRMLTDIKIMGVVIEGNNKYVIINNSIVKEKEIWQELLIDRIEKDCLVVIYQGLPTTVFYKNEVTN